MLPLKSRHDEFIGKSYIDSTTSHPFTTRRWNIRPGRSLSPPLSELYPEYYEPIEPGQKTPPHESSSFDVASVELEYVAVERNIAMLEDAQETKDKRHQEKIPPRSCPKTRARDSIYFAPKHRRQSRR